MALSWARIGARAGESGRSRARLARRPRLARSSSPAVRLRTSSRRLSSGTAQPGTFVLLGDYRVELAAQVSLGRATGHAVDDGTFQVAAAATASK
jgi:hypothetical protein